MRARMRAAGVGGVTAVTMVTALFAGSEPSSASEVPAARDLQGLKVLPNLWEPANRGPENPVDLDGLAALADLADLGDLGDNEGARILRSFQRGKGVDLRDLSLRVGSGTVEIVSSEDPGEDRAEKRGDDGGEGDGGEGRLTRELRVTDGEGAHRVFRLGGTGAGAADVSNRSILVRYDQFSPANAFVRPDAVTYDRAKVPAGASIGVTRTVTDGATSVQLEVGGLPKNRTYGAHVHTEPCGAKPEEAGSHYQDKKDPVRPSTDPRYANPRNEVWLDFTTNAKGEGKAVSRHDWTFRKGEARSVVLHESGTRTEAGHAGEAGARLACFTVPLAGR
ncbi:superoxide dismutase family protein [Streptomyces tubbatahanensis]|uniref:Superoxide dismutase family protein n=1 Tax=Streptomyces tubbatahanensis TaxID=2923272 RepID=A0ABY3XR75_9ACTN|nr:superoxide dismutase family protein [Streptomyces tubbatahanensis]UNS96849.1 superoxide dismutase family protein [Streptomyces tubbatahanensis]